MGFDIFKTTTTKTTTEQVADAPNAVKAAEDAAFLAEYNALVAESMAEDRAKKKLERDARELAGRRELALCLAAEEVAKKFEAVAARKATRKAKALVAKAVDVRMDRINNEMFISQVLNDENGTEGTVVEDAAMQLMIDRCTYTDLNDELIVNSFDQLGKRVAMIIPVLVAMWTDDKIAKLLKDADCVPSVKSSEVPSYEVEGMLRKHIMSHVAEHDTTIEKEGSDEEVRYHKVQYVDFKGNYAVEQAVMSILMPVVKKTMDAATQQKVSKRLASLLSPAEAMTIHIKRLNRWMVVRSDRFVGLLNRAPRFGADYSEKANLYFDGLVVEGRNFGKAMRGTVNTYERFGKARAFFAGGKHGKGMTMTSEDQMIKRSYDVLFKGDLKDEVKFGGASFYSTGFRAESGKKAFQDISISTMSAKYNEWCAVMYAKETAELIKEFNTTVKNTTLGSKLIGDDDKSAMVKFIEKQREYSSEQLRKMVAEESGDVEKVERLKRRQHASSLMLNGMMEGIDVDQDPFTAFQSMCFGQGKIRNIMRKNRVPMKNAIRVYALCYDPDVAPSVTSPVKGQVALEESKDGFIACFINRQDWASKGNRFKQKSMKENLTQCSGGSDTDDSWIIALFDISMGLFLKTLSRKSGTGSNVCLMVRQPKGPGDGNFFTVRISEKLRESLFNTVLTGETADRVWAELWTVIKAVRNLCGDTTGYEALLGFDKAAYKASTEDLVPNTVAADDKIDEDTLGGCIIDAMSDEDLISFETHIAELISSGVGIACLTNVLKVGTSVVADSVCGTGKVVLTETEEALCALVRKYNLMETTVDNETQGGGDEAMLKLVKDLYWYYIKNVKQIEKSAIDRLPLACVSYMGADKDGKSVERSRCFGLKRLYTMENGKVTFPMTKEERPAHALTRKQRKDIEGLFTPENLAFNGNVKGVITKRLDHHIQYRVLEILGYTVYEGSATKMCNSVLVTFKQARLRYFAGALRLQVKTQRQLLETVVAGGVTELAKDVYGSNASLMRWWESSFDVKHREMLTAVLKTWIDKSIDYETSCTRITNFLRSNYHAPEELEMFYKCAAFAGMLQINYNKKAGKLFCQCMRWNKDAVDCVNALHQLTSKAKELSPLAQEIKEHGAKVTFYGEDTLEKNYLWKQAAKIGNMAPGSVVSRMKDGTAIRNRDRVIYGRTPQAWMAKACHSIYSSFTQEVK